MTLDSQPPHEHLAKRERGLPVGCLVGLGIFGVLLALMVLPGLKPVPPANLILNEIQVWERQDQTLWIIAQVSRREYRNPPASPPCVDSPTTVIVAGYTATGALTKTHAPLSHSIRQEAFPLFWWAGELYLDKSRIGNELAKWRQNEFVDLSEAETKQLIRDMGCDRVKSDEWYGCADRASRDDGAKLLIEIDQFLHGELCKALNDSVSVTIEPHGDTVTLSVAGTSTAGPWRDVVVDTREL